MNPAIPVRRALIILLILVSGETSAAPTSTAVSAVPLPALQWRLLGPFRGGWSTMAVGVPEEPDVYYAAAAGGGVWKTTDAGRTWSALTDSKPIATVGAIAVAPSNPRVVYIGTGQPEPRYDVGAGTGVYRSADAGRTWQGLGLAATRHIGAIVVDRRNADTVLVAAQGHLFGPNEERGVYRSEDGGRTWTRSLFVDTATGAVDLAVDPANPDVVFAATWTARVWPWLSYFTPVEGDGSALWRSTDGGRNWQRLGGEGWPTGPLGRIGVAVTRAGSALRIYASVDRSAGDGGLYRSDDGGGHWRRVNEASWLTVWYMSRLTVSPNDPDTLYTIGRSVHESKDGGATFTIVRGAPGGDDYHFLWINPKEPSHRVLASDQGASITVNGGETWSDWYNQPTGQFYYLAADERFPYRIYSGQQDSGTVSIASRSDYGALGLRDRHPVGGDERDYDLPDPDDPAIVYGSGLGGRISRFDERTGLVTNVTPWPVMGYGKRASDYRYHYNWFSPIAFAPFAPHALYAGSQVLWRSLDRGAHWESVSPDLSGRREGAADCGGNPDPSRALACGYGSINVIAPSPNDAAELWVGTDDGLLWLTRDSTRTWRRVTPPGVPVWAKVSSIDLVPKGRGMAYVAVDNHRQDDLKPYVFVTRDYGATWHEIGAGLPADRFVSVVRADPVRPGLLYAGTEMGVYVSFDDGGHWQDFNLNLPPVWVHDLMIKDRDLVAATVGRALWVLDDLSPLRQWRAFDAPLLAQPAPAWRLRGNQNKDTPLTPETPLGQNPPTGAVIDYYLPRRVKVVELEFRDGDGAVVRRFSSAEPERVSTAERYFAERWVQRPALLGTEAGAHRFVWDLREPRPRSPSYEWSIAATPFEGTMPQPAGAIVLPGDYRVSLTADGRRLEAPLSVRADPRVPVNPANLAAARDFGRALSADLALLWQGQAEISAVRGGLAAQRKALAGDTNRGLSDRLAALDRALGAIVDGNGEHEMGLTLAGKTLATIATDVEGSDEAPTSAQREVATRAHTATQADMDRWQAVRSRDLADLNRDLLAAGRQPVTVPDPAHLRAAEPPEGQDLP
jgi:photosystem II stability/assembly factor-like uncharacterized protein